MEKAFIDKYNIPNWIIVVVIYGFLILGLLSNIFTIVAFILCIIILGGCKDFDVQCIIIAIMPFANIFKLSPGGTSFFTYILMLYVIWNLIHNLETSGLFIAILLFSLFALEVQVLNNTLDTTRYIKFVFCWYYIFYAITNIQLEQVHEIFYYYIVGVIISSLLQLSGLFPSINMYLVDNTIFGKEGIVHRFAGLYPDPNYYSINIIISLYLLVVLFDKGEIKGIPAIVLAGLLIEFALLTRSKSALLMLSLPLVMLIYSNKKNGRFSTQLIVLLSLITIVWLILLNKIDALDVVLYRLESADDIDSLTTGRSAIWETYFSTFANEGWELIFGKGLGAPLINGKGTHNTYIDIIYYLGIIGGIGLLYIIISLGKMIYTERKVSLLNLGIIVCLIFMYCFLGQLFFFDMPFQIYLGIIVLKMNFFTADANKIERRFKKCSLIR